MKISIIIGMKGEKNEMIDMIIIKLLEKKPR